MSVSPRLWPCLTNIVKLPFQLKGGRDTDFDKNTTVYL